MNSDNLKYVIREFIERGLPNSLSRAIDLPIGTGKIIGLSGVRRSGKTYLFFETIKKLVNQGVNRRQIVYLNFEDDRLHPVRAEELDLVIRCLRELYPALSGRLYIFLDEVQSVPGWERWVRRIQDHEQADVFVTGSSSHLLSRDLSTALRGRSITFEVFPLSFREYLSFQNIVVTPYSAENESRVRSALESYLIWGGFPEIVLAEEALRPLILEEYASLMLYRDILERYHIRNEKLMRELLRHCFRNTATLMNISKLYRDFRSRGFTVSKNTLFEYVGYLEDSFLIFLLPKCEASIRKQEHNPKKLHVVDTGLISAFLPYPMRNIGYRLETAVFLEMRRLRKDLYYLMNGSEVDLCDGSGLLFINTSYGLLDQETLRRETEAMSFGHAKWPKAKGYFAYHEYSPGLEQQIDNSIPAWKLLAGDLAGALGK